MTDCEGLVTITHVTSANYITELPLCKTSTLPHQPDTRTEKVVFNESKRLKNGVAQKWVIMLFSNTLFEIKTAIIKISKFLDFLLGVRIKFTKKKFCNCCKWLQLRHFCSISKSH